MPARPSGCGQDRNPLRAPLRGARQLPLVQNRRAAFLRCGGRLGLHQWASQLAGAATALLAGVAVANASHCSRKNVLGTSRVIAVDAKEYPRVGRRAFPRRCAWPTVKLCSLSRRAQAAEHTEGARRRLDARRRSFGPYASAMDLRNRLHHQHPNLPAAPQGRAIRQARCRSEPSKFRL